jgi:integrase
MTRSDLMDLMEEVAARAPGSARTVFAYIRRFFNWCVEQEYLASAPTDRMALPYRTVKRDRVLRDDELAIAWRAFDLEPGLFGPLFKLLLLTGQRRSEVAGIRWEEVSNLQAEEINWEIPGGRTKNRMQHLVPLPPLAIEILASQPRAQELVFTTTGTTPASGFSKAKERIDKRIRAWREAEGLPDIPPWHLHDLRRTMITCMNEKLGVPPHVVEAVVNHLSGAAKAGVAGVYNRALYLGERRRALEVWAEWLRAICCV